MAIELYAADFSPPCNAVIFTAKELAIDLKITNINLFAGEHLTPDFLRLNPQHCIPTLVDHSNGLVLWESRAIQTYLVNKYSPGHTLYPSQPEQRALVDRCLYFESGTLYPLQAAAFYGQFWGKGIDEEKRKAYDEKLQILDKGIDQKKYLTGEHKSLADLSLMCSLVAGEALGADLSPHANIVRWLGNMRSEEQYVQHLQTMSQGLKGAIAKK